MTYSVLEENSCKIIDMETLQVTQSTSSVAMEKDAFRICLNRLIEKGVNVAVVVTDRSPSIRKIMATEFGHIHHQFDIWHVCKSMYMIDLFLRSLLNSIKSNPFRKKYKLNYGCNYDLVLSKDVKNNFSYCLIALCFFADV